jgi:deferrochelatase/peroxidase EfeB
VAKHSTLQLDLNEIQGDLLSGMQKHAELFLFFKIADAARFKAVAREYVVGRLTNLRTVQERARMVEAWHRSGGSGQMPWLGRSFGFTRDGLTQLLGVNRPRMDPAFERGAAHPQTIAALDDPPPAQWVSGFRSDRVDGVFLIAGPDKSFVTSDGNALSARLGTAIKTVYSEIGAVRPERERGHEHFGFLDGISHRAIRGLTPVSRPSAAPEQGLPGQDLIWAGEFILGYPAGPARPVDRFDRAVARAVGEERSYLVFRRLEQKVPEFWRFVRERSGLTRDGPAAVGGANGRTMEERCSDGACAVARQCLARKRRQPQQRFRVWRRPRATEMSLRRPYSESVPP